MTDDQPTGITATTIDHVNGDAEAKELDDYVLVVGPGYHVAHEQRFSNGTTILTVKRVEP